nr:MAG TPA: hypothetical protein [Caudoviricetes sp.]
MTPAGEAQSYDSFVSLQSSSRETPRASASLIAVETRQSSRFSISWIVRRGTPLSFTRSGTERPLLVLMLLRFMVIPP